MKLLRFDNKLPITYIHRKIDAKTLNYFYELASGTFIMNKIF